MPIPDPRGLYSKYHVARVDGADAPGGRRAEARYFVMDYRFDPDAWASVASYCVYCALRRPALAADLAKGLMETLPHLEADPAAAAALHDIFAGPVRETEVFKLVHELALRAAPNV